MCLINHRTSDFINSCARQLPNINQSIICFSLHQPNKSIRSARFTIPWTYLSVLQEHSAEASLWRWNDSLETPAGLHLINPGCRKNCTRGQMKVLIVKINSLTKLSLFDYLCCHLWSWVFINIQHRRQQLLCAGSEICEMQSCQSNLTVAVRWKPIFANIPNWIKPNFILQMLNAVVKILNLSAAF